MKTQIQLAALLLALSASSTQYLSAQDTAPTAAEEAIKPLKMGDPAPEFKVTQWFKGDPVTLDEKGTYIVECWATWCGPCIAAFPHLSEIAEANKGKITVIGVNVWERKSPEEVKAFVEKQGDKMKYLVAADGDKVIENQWLRAAGRTGIPCAFVVNKGKVAWIGHPGRLDQPSLDSIIDGTFDLEAFAKQEEIEKAFRTSFSERVIPLLRKKDIEAAVSELEKMKKDFPTKEADINNQISRMKTQMAR